jgi:aminoglycoside phosphotransferase (APT) family kinase protein
MTTTTDGRGGIDAALVERLVAAQFPQWAGLPVRPVELDGWDNRTYRLGDDLTVRLPSHPAYAAAVAKEQEWLPRLAPYLPVPVPVPVGRGRPGCGYPLPWTVNRWLPGTTADPARIDDVAAFAADLAGFLVALRTVDAAGGPKAGDHSFHRGGNLGAYDEETRTCLAALADRPWAAEALEVWEVALDSRWTAAPVWVHGDVATGNLLVRDGRLSAVIDFGCSAVGDPACDLVIAWTFLPDQAREVFRAGVDLDEASWARARGWALWKALRGLVDGPDPLNERTVARLLTEHG